MKRPLRNLLIGIAIVLVGIQFVPVTRMNPPVETEVPVTPEVRTVLKESCYDCHSNETVWPWYSGVAPVAWLVAYDVQEAREKLNFSTWNRYDAKEQAHKVEEILEEVGEGKMPLPKYVRLHPGARITPGDMALLRQWAGTVVPEGQGSGTDGDDQERDEAGER